MIEANFALFPVPVGLDVEPEDGADRAKADALIQYLTRFAGRRYSGPMLTRVRWVVTRSQADLDALVLHDCEDCAAALGVARNAIAADPTRSIALGLELTALRGGLTSQRGNDMDRSL